MAAADLLLDSQESSDEGLVHIAVELSPSCDLLHQSTVLTSRAHQSKVASSCIFTCRAYSAKRGSSLLHRLAIALPFTPWPSNTPNRLPSPSAKVCAALKKASWFSALKAVLPMCVSPAACAQGNSEAWSARKRVHQAKQGWDSQCSVASGVVGLLHLPQFPGLCLMDARNLHGKAPCAPRHPRSAQRSLQQQATHHEGAGQD